jgi:peroxiredoxin (alkyl hydroperoxide reductase subunit C)
VLSVAQHPGLAGLPVIWPSPREVQTADTSTVRTTFLIDPEGILRAMVYYPMTNGRSIAEFLRLLDALQTSDEHQVVTPEGWQPGDPVIVPPPATVQAAKARMEEGLECQDWYFCKKTLPEAALQKA